MNDLRRLTQNDPLSFDRGKEQLEPYRKQTPRRSAIVPQTS
jgi:hypothetical protein